MARKGENIYKRKDGRWEGRYNKGRRPDGSILYGSIYGKKYSEVRKRLISIKTEYALRKNKMHDNFGGTVGEWFTHWLEHEIKTSVKPSTYSSYRHKIETYVVPLLGDIRLEKVHEADIQLLVRQLSGRGYRPTTITTILRICRSALEAAVSKNFLPANPCTNVRLALPPKIQIKALTRKDQKTLEQAALMGHKACVATILGLYTGLRIGEVSALRWNDIDFNREELVVRHTIQRLSNYTKTEAKSHIVIGSPKSRNSLRVIPLAPRLRTFLLQHKQHATSEYVVECKKSFAEPRVITYRFAQLVKLSGLEEMSFHCLRHTFATRCLENNVDVATLSYLLGHSSAKMTLDTYTASLSEQRRSAMLKIDMLLQEEDESRS